MHKHVQDKPTLNTGLSVLYGPEEDTKGHVVGNRRRRQGGLINWQTMCV